MTAQRLREALVAASCCLALSAVACGAARRDSQSSPQGRELRCVENFGSIAGGAEPAARVAVVALRKKAWEAEHGGEVAARAFIRARMGGWPARMHVKASELPRDDGEFLRRVARDTWRGLKSLTDRPSGLPVDNVHFDAAPAAGRPEGRIGDYSSATDIGLYLAAIVAAADLGFIDAAEERERATRILDTLDRLERFRGFFYNFYDTTSLERTSNFISFVDAGWLLAGLVVLRSAVPELAERATRLIDAQDFSLFYDSEAGLIRHGYWVHERHPSIFHYGVFYAESRLGALLAIGKGDVPASTWAKMMRIVPPMCARAGPPVTATVLTSAGNPSAPEGYYQWDDARYVPSWGGSMFEALMPLLLVDEVGLAPRSLGRNALVHARVQQRYALQTLGYPVWGMSPCAAVDGPTYAEFGAPVLGVRGYTEGVVTPHAAALALAVTPDEAVHALRRMTELYDLYGDFGFYDAVDPRTGRVAYAYLALDQAMTFLALANHLDAGRLRTRFASDPLVARALPLLGAESFELD